MDEFCVSGGEGDGVVASVQVSGDVPDVGRAVWRADDGVDEVRPGRGLCRKNGLASAVEFYGRDVIAAHAGKDRAAVGGAAGRGKGLHGLAGGGVGGDGDAELAEDFVHALAHDVDRLAGHGVRSGGEGGGDDDAHGGAGGG